MGQTPPPRITCCIFFSRQYSIQASLLAQTVCDKEMNENQQWRSQTGRSLQDKNLVPLFALAYELIQHQIALVPTYSHHQNQQKDALT